MGHARALSKLENKDQINKLANMIVRKQLSVRQVEELTKTEDKTNKIKRKPSTRYIKEEKYLSSYLNHKVKIDEKKITIYYHEDELAEVISRLLKK